jgi:hypothetical protein
MNQPSINQQQTKDKSKYEPLNLPIITTDGIDRVLPYVAVGTFLCIVLILLALFLSW